MEKQEHIKQFPTIFPLGFPLAKSRALCSPMASLSEHCFLSLFCGFVAVYRGAPSTGCHPHSGVFPAAAARESKQNEKHFQQGDPWGQHTHTLVHI